MLMNGWVIVPDNFIHKSVAGQIWPRGPSGLNYSILLKWKWSCSVVSDSEIPWTVAYQAPLSMGFSRQEYWSGLPFPSPGDLPHPGIKLSSPTLWVGALPCNYSYEQNVPPNFVTLHNMLHIHWIPGWFS